LFRGQPVLPKCLGRSDGNSVSTRCNAIPYRRSTAKKPISKRRASNDDWRNGAQGFPSQQSEIIATGIPPINDLESAIVATLPANGANYTAIVRGYHNATGVALLEIYALN
jgi:hypothetical protein